MKKTLSIITITGFLSILVIASAYAMRPGMGHGNMGDGAYGCFNSLTPEEQSALKAEKTKFFNETRELRTEIFNKRMALEQEFTNETPDSDKIKNLRTEIFSLKKDMAEKRQAHMERLNEIIPGFADCGFGMNPGPKHHKFKGNGGCRGFMGAAYNQ